MAFKYLFAALAVLCTIQATAGQTDPFAGVKASMAQLSSNLVTAISSANAQTGHGGGSTDAMWSAAANALQQLKSSLEMSGTMVLSTTVSGIDNMKMEADQTINMVKSSVESQISQVTSNMGQILATVSGTTAACINEQKTVLENLSAGSVYGIESCVNGRLQESNSLPSMAASILGVAQTAVDSAINGLAACVRAPAPAVECLNNYIMSVSSAASMIPMQISQMGDSSMRMSANRNAIYQCSNDIMSNVSAGVMSAQQRISNCVMAPQG